MSYSVTLTNKRAYVKKDYYFSNDSFAKAGQFIGTVVDAPDRPEDEVLVRLAPGLEGWPEESFGPGTFWWCYADALEIKNARALMETE